MPRLTEEFWSTSEDLNIVNVNVRSAADTAFVYPGSKRVDLKIEVVYLNGTANASSVVGWLKTTEGIGFSSGSGACSPALLLNRSVAEKVALGDYITFEYLLDISASLTPGTYQLMLNISYFKESALASETHQIDLIVSPYPPLALRVVDAYFSPAPYIGSGNTNLYIILENAGNNSINSADFNVTLPENFTVENPRASTGLVNKGDRFTLTFSGVSIPSNVQASVYNLTLFADVSARTEDGVPYSDSTSFIVAVKVETPPPEQPLMLGAVNTFYNGSPSPLLPSAKNVVLRVYLVNKLTEAISAMSVNVVLPDRIYVRAVSGTYINGATPGGSCFVDVTVDVDSQISVGIKEGILNVTYLKTVSGSSFIMHQTVRFPINVETVHSYVPEVSLVTAYWGYPDPTPVYPTSRYVPLTVRLINEGRYSIEGIVVNVSSPLLTPIKGSDACSTTLVSGGYCTAVLYFDINTSALNVPAIVSVSYKFTEYGTHINLAREFNLPLLVESYPASESLISLVDAGWENSAIVFPKTSNATYQITLANRAPYSIAGIKLQLKIPAGMLSKGKNEATSYFEGPVRSLATFTASFTVSVGEVSPGSYDANLTVDCILLSGGPGVRRVENLKLYIDVNDDGSALQIADSRWYEGSVGPNTYGAHLIVLVRNVYVDGLRGALLKLDLPKGMYNSADNSSSVKITPVSIQLPQPLQAQNLMEILTNLLNAPQVNPTQVFNRGDFLTFMTTVNLFDVKVGTYKINGSLSYIDLWGGEREIPIVVSVPILGKTEYLEISMDRNINLRSRFVNASLNMKNRGSSPIYDAYLAISPYQGAPILIASPAVNYIESIGAGESVSIPITLAYNPLGFYAQTVGASSITYGPVPLMVSVIYRDAGGSSNMFNNSITVTVEPFIDLLIRNVRATGTNSSSTVTGIIVNCGSSAAYRVEAELKVGERVESSFIGDVDPGSEVAFRVDVDKFSSSAVLSIKYYNVFNEVESKQINVTVKLQEETTTKPPQIEQPYLERWIIVAGVIVFMAIAILLIYKMMKKARINNRT